MHKVFSEWTFPRLLVLLHFFSWASAMMSVWINYDQKSPTTEAAFVKASWFFSRLDALVFPQVERLALWLGSKANGVLDTESFVWVMFTLELLIAGSLQWYVIGYFVDKAALQVGAAALKIMQALPILWILNAWINWLS